MIDEIINDISICCDVDKDNLIDLVNYKSVDYRFKDLKKGVVKSEDYYNQRALNVVREYYVRKFNYSSNWVE